ncbi:hypothetical protein RIF29_18645 [Crotalaria pallida]|uniref:THIF-type NAD/FAD binding fold domain-containing protein n=1 Tax=Crotalaria pallida TaxID=3830 RepID=A0AAN9IAM3_CROPI
MRTLIFKESLSYVWAILLDVLTNYPIQFGLINYETKNLILACVKSVTLHDEGTVELWDLSSNFVFSEKYVGKNKAVTYVSKLQKLNNAVLVQSLTTKLTKEQLSNFQDVH